MAARRRSAAAATASAPTPPTSLKGRRPRVSASEVEAKKLQDQAMAEAETDEATRALLSDPVMAESSADEDDEESVEVVDLTESDEDAPPDLPQAKPAELLPAPVQNIAVPAMIRHHRGRVFLPDSRRHMSEMGPVCTINWIGMVSGQRVSVRFGAPLAIIPMNVRREMAKSPRVRFAIAPKPERQGGVVVDDDDRSAPPRARRSNPNARTEERVRSRFSPIRHLPTE